MLSLLRAGRQDSCVVFVDELRETQGTGHAGGASPTMTNVGVHLGAGDVLRGLRKISI